MFVSSTYIYICRVFVCVLGCVRAYALAYARARACVCVCVCVCVSLDVIVLNCLLRLVCDFFQSILLYVQGLTN